MRIPENIEGPSKTIMHKAAIGAALLTLCNASNASEAMGAGDPIEIPPPIGTIVPQPETTIPPNFLPKPSSLEGYDKPLLPGAKERLRTSTVKIGVRYGDSVPMPLFTGVNVSTPTGNYIYTVAHGFSNLTGAGRDGRINGSKDQPPAYNYIDRASGRDTQYVILDPLVPKNDQKDVAVVTGISVSNRNQDQAALSYSPVDPTADIGPSRRISEFTAMPLATEQRNAVPRPKRGQKVFMIGFPQATGNRPLGGLGRYAGRLKLPTALYPNGTPSSYKLIDFVGIKPENPAQDSCNFGASGESFVATSKGDVTYTSGSLAERTNVKWDPSIEDANDLTSQRGDLTNEISAGNAYRDKIQSKLGVDLRSFSTICGFTVNLPQTAHNLIYDGFSNPAPLEQSGKGGIDLQSMK